MPKGGARVNSGPPPDPNALRRDRAGDKDGWTTLPARHEGPVPAWPLLSWTSQLRDGASERGAEAAETLDAREVAVWQELWTKPAAAAWSRLGWVHDVALYVRFLVQAEMGSKDAATEARQWSDRLGLNPAAMLRNRWKVAPDQVADRRDERSPARGLTPGRGQESARSRLRSISASAG